MIHSLLTVSFCFGQAKKVEKLGDKKGKPATASICKLKCKAEIIPDMDCYFTFNAKKSPLIKAGRSYRCILSCGDNMLELETTDKIKWNKIIAVSDTNKKVLTAEFMGVEKFMDYVKEGNITMIETCLKKHPEFADNKNNDFDVFPIILATEKGNMKVLKMLLDKGASTNPPNDFSPLHTAVITNNIDAFKLLLDKKANFNAKDPGGWTPLHFAANYGRTEFAEELLKRGADVNAKTNQKETPLKIALDKARITIADMLKEKGGVEE